MYQLKDTFNDKVISNHRLLTRAIKAQMDLDGSMPGNSYLPTVILKDGEPMQQSEIEDIKYDMMYG